MKQIRAFCAINPVFGAIRVLCAMLLLNACQTTTEPVAAGYDYQPLEKGHFWVYEVTEQRFSLNGSATMQTYQLRETITQVFNDPASDDPKGGTLYRIERQRRNNENLAWQPDSVSSIRISANQLIRTDNNRPVVKLVFPVTELFVWDGNAFTVGGEDQYQVKNTGKAFSILNQTFAETATVVQQNDSTLVKQDKRLEVYARQVGLIYKENVQLQFCSSTPSCVGKAQIDYGIRQYIRLRSYGKE